MRKIHIKHIKCENHHKSVLNGVKDKPMFSLKISIDIKSLESRDTGMPGGYKSSEIPTVNKIEPVGD